MTWVMRSIKVGQIRRRGSTTFEASSTVDPITLTHILSILQNLQIRRQPNRRPKVATTRPNRTEQHIGQQHRLRCLSNRAGMLPVSSSVLVSAIQPVLRIHASRCLGELLDGRCVSSYASDVEISPRHGADSWWRVHEWECAELSWRCYG